MVQTALYSLKLDQLSALLSLSFIIVHFCFLHNFFSVLQSIWSLLTQCSHLFGGLLASIGYHLVGQLQLMMRRSFTGKLFSWVYQLSFTQVTFSTVLLHILFCFHRLTITFLAFDVFFVVICVVVACVIGIAVCCCLPCIIAILYAVADQVGLCIYVYFYCLKFWHSHIIECTPQIGRSFQRGY